MKKIIIGFVIVLSIVLIASLGWFFLLRDKSIPVEEAIRGILPFGSPIDIPRSGTGNGPVTDGNGNIILDEFSTPTESLFRISNASVAGAVAFLRNNQTVVRYVDRATGHIYDVALPEETDQTPLQKIKVTNNTFPKIYEAYFRSDGNAVVLRYLKNDTDVVENLSLTLTPPPATVSTTSPEESPLYTVTSTLLRGNIDAMAVGAGNSILYVLKDTGSVVSSAFDGSNTKTLFTSSFTDWRLATAGNTVVLHTKAASDAPGYAYNLNTSSGALTKVAGPLNALVAVPNTTGARILYSYINGGTAVLSAKNIGSGAVSQMWPSVAEKCVWSAKNTGLAYCGVPIDGVNAGEPDNWYRGITHFSDRIWFFDANTETSEVLAEPDSFFDVEIDLIEPKLSPNEDYLVFINKNDLSLWAFRLQ